MEDKFGRFKFFQETFLVINTKFKAVLRMLFLKISNADMSFGKKTLMWKSYITIKALSTIKEVQIVDPKKFVIAASDMDNETFVVHIVIQK